MGSASPRAAVERHRPVVLAGSATVSVVIACYNYARYLPAAVDSALSQPLVKVDVVIVDDASTDDSLAVARDLAAADPRVTVLTNEHNLGAVATFNRGLEHAHGEFLVRLDADDLLTPGSLARAVAVMQAFPSVGLVYGHPLHFTTDALPQPRSEPRAWLVWFGREWLAARCADGSNVITSPEVLMRMSVVDIVGGLRPLAHTHDMEMWFRIAAHADVGYITGVDQAWHREHSLSLSNQAADPRVILGEVRAAFKELFGGLGDDYPDRDALHASARRAVARAALDQAARRMDRGRPDEVSSDLLQFAAETDPAAGRSLTWRRLDANSHRRSSTAALRGLVPRTRRWLRHKVRYRRWARSGVYEPLSMWKGVVRWSL